jgi:pullulanase
VRHFRDMLQIRKESRLFRLGTAEEIQHRVAFLNTGPKQAAGLIVMAIDGSESDAKERLIVVLFNASPRPQTFFAAELKTVALDLHPVLAESADPIVRKSSFDKATGVFGVPGRTTAVFVATK